MKLYRVVASSAFHDMLLEHTQFLANKSPAAAIRLRRDVVAALRSLQELPQRNPLFADIICSGTAYYRLLVAKRYLLLYRITDDTVSVDYILDCRQEYSWLV